MKKIESDNKLIIILLLLSLFLLVAILPLLPVHADGTVVTFPDANLEAAIREAIGNPSGPIYDSDLEHLTQLDARYRDITNLTGLEYCTSLHLLNLGDNQINDISPLAGLFSITDLGLWDNHISDISPLAGLTNIDYLSLEHNQISDISPLAGLTNLYWLGLDENQISDISPLSNLTHLEFLHLKTNQISDISPLASLTKLENLYLDGNQVSDIYPLVANTGMSSEDDVYLDNNPLSCVSINTYIPQLQARGVSVDYDAVCTPTPAPTLISPADGTMAAGTIIQGTGTAQVTLNCVEIPQVTLYQYQIAYDQSFSNIATTGTIEGTSITKYLFLGEQYYWRVRTYSPTIGPWSEIWNFTSPLGSVSAKPVCISPSSGSTGISLSPVLQWSSSVDATGYEVVVAKNCDWSNPVINLTGSSALESGTAYQITQQLQTNSNYCWKVRSLNSDVASPWSDTGTFTTAGTSPTPSTPTTVTSTPTSPTTTSAAPTATKSTQTPISTSTQVPTSTPTPTSQTTITISGTIGQYGGTVESSDGRVLVTFPSGSLSDDTQVTITSGSCHSSDSNFRVGDSCFSIAADGAYAGLYGTTICMEYSDYDLSLANGDTSLLTLGYYSGGTWHEADNVSISGNKICCTTDHLSDWAVLIKQISESSIPLVVYIGGGIGAVAVIAILLALRRRATVSSETNTRIRRMKTQMNNWRGEGYDVSDLEDLFK